MLKSLVILLAMLCAAVTSDAQTMSAPQLVTVCTAVKADATANAARLAGDTTALLNWLNGARSPAALAWATNVEPNVADEAPSYTTFDALAAGKRDSWGRFLAYPRNFSRAKVRNWVVDVWGSATAGSNAEAILLAATYSATNAQYAIGGTTRTTGTVSALDLTYPYTAPQSVADWLVVAANCV